MPLHERVLRTVRKYGLAPPGARVVVGLSGGPDSVALVHLLLELQAAGGWTVAGLAHFNHQLRGKDADDDECFCRAMAGEIGLPIEVDRGDVAALARERGRSIEDAARLVRYAFLEEAAGRLRADTIAVGHSLDDQAETFLLRLLRGAGPRGLGGIYPRAGRVVRPLIEIRRDELRRYAESRNLRYREDATNADVSIPRNRVRHELIPLIERDFAPGIAVVLAREAAIARDDEDRLHAEAIDLAVSIVLVNRDETVRVDAAALASLHPALSARVARLALEAAAPGRFFGFEQVERLLGFVRDARPGTALSLPGLRARRDAGGIVLAAAPPRRLQAQVSNPFRIPLSIPGEVTLDSQGWSIAALRDAEAGEGVSRTGRGDGVAVQAGRLRLPLAVRTRKPGDRVRPAGMGGGSRKLQDVFVDRKVPRETRDSIPIVVDAEDRIVWVAGHVLDEEFRVTEPLQGVIFLKARRLGGLG